jgi:hypothetical protein
MKPPAPQTNAERIKTSCNSEKLAGRAGEGPSPLGRADRQPFTAAAASKIAPSPATIALSIV